MSSKNHEESGYGLDLDLLTIYTNCVFISQEKVGLLGEHVKSSKYGGPRGMARPWEKRRS